MLFFSIILSVTIVLAVLEKDCLTYLGPEKFPTRRNELMQKKPSKEISIDQSQLVVKDKQPELPCPTVTELEIANAFKRRALAFDLAGASTYDTMAAYHADLMDHLHLPAPPGYTPVSAHQILRADRAAFLFMSEKMNTLKRSASGALPLDVLLPSILNQPTVAFHLLPLAGSANKASSSTKTPATERKRSRTPTRHQPKNKGRGKGKSKKGRGPNVPSALIGKALETPQKRLCWAFNLPNGCSAAKPGETCSKGLHVCAEPGCTARLTASLRALGLVDSVGIDSVLPNRLNGPIIKLDLLNPSHLAHVESLIRNKACVYVHFAPPCGTASRARLIQNNEQNLPPPLRNDQYPNGLPWLTMDQQIRVDKGNNLYGITCRLIRLCEDHQILGSCENPGRSSMWQTTPFQELFSTMQCLSTAIHHCMFGWSWRKLTRLIHNISSFRHLHQLCDNCHEHEPWGQKPDGSWATAEETAYPWPRARSIAAQVLLQLQDLGVECHPPSCAEQEATLQAMRAATNIQPRKNLPSLVPEFKEVTTQAESASLPSRARKLSTPKWVYVASAPKGQVTIGIHFSPEEFIQEALSLRHPTEQQSLFVSQRS